MGAVVGKTFYFDFEVMFMHWLQNILPEKMIKIISFFSAFGEEMLLILIIGFLYWCYDKKIGKTVGSIIVLGIVANPLVKNIFWRRRPYFDHETIKCLRPVEPDADIYDIAAQGFSFPSGHSTNAVTAYGSIAVSMKKRVFTVIGIALPLLIGFSRMVVGVHYPTDVLCGWLLGGVCILIMNTLFKRVSEEKTWIVYIIIFAISCIGLLYCKTSDYFSSLGLMGGIYAAFEFEKRFVDFKNTRKPLSCVFRIFGGIALYLLLNTVLKLPFSSEFLASGTFLAGLVRTFRYMLVSFIVVGIYPFAFRIEK